MDSNYQSHLGLSLGAVVNNVSKSKWLKNIEEFTKNESFIRNLAYTLQNVLKKTKNSYVHGYIIYSYLSDYLNKFTTLETFSSGLKFF